MFDPIVIDGGLSQDEIAAEVERTRLQVIIDLDRRINRMKVKRALAASEFKNTMGRDGVVRCKYDNGTAYLAPQRYWATPSQRRRERARFGCNLQGRRDPYLVVVPIGGPDDAA